MQPKNTSDLPHWDMTPFFPGLDSPEFEAAFTKLVGEIADLTRLFRLACCPRAAERDADQLELFPNEQ